MWPWLEPVVGVLRLCVAPARGLYRRIRVAPRVHATKLCRNLVTSTAKIRKDVFEFYSCSSKPTSTTSYSALSPHAVLVESMDRWRDEVELAGGACSRVAGCGDADELLCGKARAVVHAATASPWLEPHEGLRSDAPALREVGRAFTEFSRALTRIRKQL